MRAMRTVIMSTYGMDPAKMSVTVMFGSPRVELTTNTAIPQGRGEKTPPLWK